MDNGVRRSICDAIDSAVHRRRREGRVHQRTEGRHEDQWLEEVWREADDGHIGDGLNQHVRRHGQHRNAPIEQLCARWRTSLQVDTPCTRSIDCLNYVYRTRFNTVYVVKNDFENEKSLYPK